MDYRINCKKRVVQENSSVASHSNVGRRHSKSEHKTSAIRRPRKRNQLPDYHNKETSRNTVNRQVLSRNGLPREGCKLHSYSPSWKVPRDRSWQEVKRCIPNCYDCKRRFWVHPVKQHMAPLPQFRLGMTYRPFTNCATDFGRPYLTSQGRGRIRTKKNSRLFLCLQTLCCHLEMATSLDAAGFLNAFTRMTRLAQDAVERQRD